MNCTFPTVEIVASIAARVKHRAKQNPIVFPLLYNTSIICIKFITVVKCQTHSAFTSRTSVLIVC